MKRCILLRLGQRMGTQPTLGNSDIDLDRDIDSYGLNFVIMTIVILLKLGGGKVRPRT